MKKILTKLPSLYLTYIFLLTAGASIVSPSAYAKSYSKLFPAKYDRVWKSTLIAITKYPLEKNDKSSGEITTSKIEEGQVYQAYQSEDYNNVFYTLNISLEKRRLKGRPVVMVKVEKVSSIKGDFMNSEKKIESNGLEENVLLYRIARELKIDHVMEKLFN